MKNSWQTKTLGELVDEGFVQLTRGKVISKKDIAVHPGSYPIYSSAKDNDGMFGKYGDFMFDEPLITWSVDGGGRLFCRSKHKFSVTNVGGILRILKPELLDYRYLYYVLSLKHSEIRFDWVKKAHPSVIRELYKGIPLPSLAEQRQIVVTLDKLFEEAKRAKEIIERNSQNAKELFGSYLESVFVNTGGDWEEKTLGEVYDVRDGTHDSPRYQKEGFALVTSKNLKRDLLNFDKIKYISEKDYKKINERSKVDKGDILFAMIGTIGNPVVVEGEPDFAIKNVALFKIPKNQCGYFLKYYLDSKSVIGKMMSEAKGTTQKFVGLGYLRSFKIGIPSLLEQKSIVKKIHMLSLETKRLEILYTQKSADVEEVKQVLLRRVISGKQIETDLVPVARVAIPSPYFRNQVHAAIIDQVVRDGGATTEVAVAKYDYLLQDIYGLALGYQFQTHQFGPFDSEIKRLVSSGLGKNRWFVKKSGMIIFGLNIDALISKQSNLYRSARLAMKELATLGVTKLDAEKVELLSTVCHSVKETESTALDSVRKYMSQWPTDGDRTKAEKFSSEQTQKCLDFIVKNNLHQRLLKTI